MRRGPIRNLRPLLRIEALTKRFGASAVVDHLSLDIYEGEFFALLGPSGCGKTTLLRLIAGFERPNAGRILLDGVDLAPVPPYRRPVNMMFQSYALFPHLNVEANIAFGLKQEGLPRREIARRVADMLALVKLEGFGRPQAARAVRRPAPARGAGALAGQAAARAAARRTDGGARQETARRDAVRADGIAAQLGLTFIIVTHDQSEAMTVADRIGVMDRGRLIQVAPPAEIYERPNSRWVADFIGDVNLFEGRLGDDGLSVEGTAAGRMRVAAKPDAETRRDGLGRGAAGEDARHARSRRQPDSDNCVAGTVVDIGYLGDRLDLQAAHPRRLAGAGRGRQCRRPPSAPVGIDEQVWLSWPRRGRDRADAVRTPMETP